MSLRPPNFSEEEQEQVLRLHAEELSFEKRVRDTGAVRIDVRTEHRDQVIDELLTRSDVTVERVPHGHFIDAIPATRQDGDTLIVPVVEEVVVTRLRLVEEVRITTVTTRHRHQETVDLRKEVATVSRSVHPDDPTPINPVRNIHHGQ